ncbi:MAG: hypothetical protein C0613_08480 [Desulfobulbaceae bacterium]|nr:MAG: hypothetical protein C0613_08480 [Desulfobulbaceae bacterium]
MAKKEIVLTDNPVEPLTAAETKQFERLQKIIHEDMRAFLRVGDALKEIHDRKLYRETWRTFEAYCKDVYDLGRSTAYQYIGAYEVVENVRSCGHFDDHDANGGPVIDLVPMNEAQCRPMASLQPDQQREVWRAVLQNLEPGKKPTASMVKKITKKYVGETTKSKVHNARKSVSEGREISGPLQKAFDVFLEEVEKEVAVGFNATPREAIVGLLDQVRHTLAEAGSKIEDAAFQGGDDAKKLMQAGYTLFRMDKASKTIKFHTPAGGWAVYEDPEQGGVGGAMPFGTIKEMQAAFEELMKNRMHLRG